MQYNYINKVYGQVGYCAILLLCLLQALPAIAETKDQADQAFKKGQYQKAISSYEKLIAQKPTAELYYNLGNAYFRTDNIARAILSYERALQLKPGDKDTRFNLNFVYSRTIDKVTPKSEMFFFAWYRSLVNTISVDAWARTAVLSIVLVLLLLLLYLFASRLLFRQIGFYGATCFFLLFLLSNLFAYQQKCQHQQNRRAVITAPTVSVKNTPGPTGTEEYLLHEGTSVNITDTTIANWSGISIADGREGWIPTSSVEEI